MAILTKGSVYKKCRESLFLPRAVYHSDSIIWNNFHHRIGLTVQVYQITIVAAEDEKVLLLEHRFLFGIYSTSLTPMRRIAQFCLLNVMVTNQKQETTHNSQQHNDGFSTILNDQWNLKPKHMWCHKEKKNLGSNSNQDFVPCYFGITEDVYKLTWRTWQSSSSSRWSHIESTCSLTVNKIKFQDDD